jgi:hypothetical protein
MTGLSESLFAFIIIIGSNYRFSGTTKELTKQYTYSVKSEEKLILIKEKIIH